ncbi:Checkpoint protein hus1 [Elasticomyces elasticus]|nr:Checkpoint protein hus1 [Elasticomyces elasticus]
MRFPWIRLSSTDIRFTVIPDHGTQVWSVLQLDTIFGSDYTCQSAAEDNAINLEVPLGVLLRALGSARQGTGASLRLTKKEGVPLLSLTITAEGGRSSQAQTALVPGGEDGFGGDEAGQSTNGFGAGASSGSESFFGPQPDRETVITQDIPVRVLAPASVEGLHQPRCREPDVHITLPNLSQLKGISDRFTRLALSTKSGSGTGARGEGVSGAKGPKLELSANMHGCLRLSLVTDSMSISSLWTGLENPELDPGSMEGEDPSMTAEERLARHPSTLMRQHGDASGLHGEEGWATVRVEGRDWGKVLSVGRLGGRVIACFIDGNALVLYVYLPSEDGNEGEDGGVLTYYVCSYAK